jgi:DNA-binding NarL/FixJ family response regulator
MIMILTPYETFRRGAFHYLQERGYDLSIPEHRGDVVTLVHQDKPDVIVLDLFVSEPNGVTVLKKLRRDGYSGKLIVISGASNRAIMTEVHQQKVDQVVSRSPTDPLDLIYDQLENSIRTVFHDQIAKNAYEFYLKRSREHGNDWEDWFKSENEMLKSHKIQG